MPKRNSVNYIVFFCCNLLLFAGCADKEKISKTKAAPAKNLNITVLLDLSDRISAFENPGQSEKDTAAIMTIVRSLKQSMEKKGIPKSDDKIKVVFYPENGAEAISATVGNLNINFADYTGPDRRTKYEKIESIYSQNLNTIYSIASHSESFAGSDLFNFFRQRAYDDCIEQDTNFINILVILTDGYLYHKDFVYSENNRFSFIAPHSTQVARFRNSITWEKDFDNQDYGFINAGVTLPRLHILALEFAPYKGNTIDFEIMKKYWSKWFVGMNIPERNTKIIRTDNPSLNADLIKKYFLGLIL